jgi:hypothetical protein
LNIALWKNLLTVLNDIDNNTLPHNWSNLQFYDQFCSCTFGLGWRPNETHLKVATKWGKNTNSSRFNQFCLTIQSFLLNESRQGIWGFLDKKLIHSYFCAFSIIIQTSWWWLLSFAFEKDWWQSAPFVIVTFIFILILGWYHLHIDHSYHHSYRYIEIYPANHVLLPVALELLLESHTKFWFLFALILPWWYM